MEESRPAQSSSGSARGGEIATKDLFTALYGELHQIARRSLLRSGADLTLGPTTLIHETYLRLSDRPDRFPDSPHFLGYASRAMRGLVIDHVRRRQAQKRGRDVEVALTSSESQSSEEGREGAMLDALADAMDELAAVDSALAELVDLHFFCGYTFAEIASVRGVSERTVQRDWRKARLLLYRAVQEDVAE